MTKCKRCGACCIIGPCSFGTEDLETGACMLLTFENGKAVCPLVGNKKVAKTVGIGKGCAIREIGFEGYFENKRKAYLDYKGILNGNEQRQKQMS